MTLHKHQHPDAIRSYVQSLHPLDRQTLGTNALLMLAEIETAAANDPLDQLIPTKPGEIERRTVAGWCYILQLINCGKEKCTTCRGSTYRHGPYWYAFARINGKMTSRYLGKDFRPLDSPPVTLTAQELDALNKPTH